VAQQLFPGQDPLNRHRMWTDGVMRFIGITTEPRRIVGSWPTWTTSGSIRGRR